VRYHKYNTVKESYLLDFALAKSFILVNIYL